MIKLLLGRVMPAGLAVALFTSALSPLRPALEAFGVASNALAGGAQEGGAAFPEGGGEAPSGGGFLSSLFAPAQKKDNARRQIEGLVENLKAKKEQQAADDASAAAAAAPKKKKKKKAATAE